MKYFLIAGEASGDIHASQLVKAIQGLDSNAQFQFFGGDLMSKAAGTKPIVHYKDMAFMGFADVIRHLPQILSFMRTAKSTIKTTRPDAVILIDYPSFNLKIAKFTKSLGIPVFYYISPKVWAWKEYRVKQIKRFVTEMYSILPFETDFYARHGYHVEYVGNPTMNEIAEASAQFVSFEDFTAKHHLDPKRKIIALIPGSREKEIRDNLPSMLEAISRFPQYQAVIGGAPGITPQFYDTLATSIGQDKVPPVIFNSSFELIHHAQAAVVTSGTATLETAILGTPQVVCFRINGSKRVYNFYKHFLKVKYISLPNLIAHAPVVTELLLHYCNPDRIALELEQIIGNTYQRREMIKEYALIRNRLTNADSALTTAKKLLSKLPKS